jgi:hypothetical protein
MFYGNEAVTTNREKAENCPGESPIPGGEDPGTKIQDPEKIQIPSSKSQVPYKSQSLDRSQISNLKSGRTQFPVAMETPNPRVRSGCEAVRLILAPKGVLKRQGITTRTVQSDAGEDRREFFESGQVFGPSSAQNWQRPEIVLKDFFER